MFQYFQEKPRKALHYILGRVHCFPNCANVRKVLANFLLKNLKGDYTYKMASNQIALSAIQLTHANAKKK